MPLKEPELSLFNIWRTDSISSKYVSGLMSANTTSPPQYRTQLAEAAKVIGEVITLLPSLTPKAKVQRCNAAVPFATATAYLLPVYSAKALSNAAMRGPCVR